MEAYLPDKKGGGEVEIVSVVQRWRETGDGGERMGE